MCSITHLTRTNIHILYNMDLNQHSTQKKSFPLYLYKISQNAMCRKYGQSHNNVKLNK